MRETDLKKRDLLKTLPLAPAMLVGMAPKEASANPLAVLTVIFLGIQTAIELFKIIREHWNELQEREEISVNEFISNASTQRFWHPEIERIQRFVSNQRETRGINGSEIMEVAIIKQGDESVILFNLRDNIYIAT